MINKSLKTLDTLKKDFVKQTFKDKSKNILWINNPQYYYTLSEPKKLNDFILNNKNIFVGGCNTEFAEFFKKNKFKTFMVAKEAVLSFSKNHFGKKSIKELIKSGNKKGTIKEIKYSLQNKELLEIFKKVCVHGNEPQIKHFFNDVFLDYTRLFVLEDKTNKWLGGTLIADIGNGIIRTDLILRRENAPRGIMEALMNSIFLTLKNEGYVKWSLGDVPFIIYNSRLFSREYLINYAGRKIKFAYNYKGLYDFKNKFTPDWNDIYVCCHSKLCEITFLKVSSISNILKLIFNKLKRQLL